MKEISSLIDVLRKLRYILNKSQRRESVVVLILLIVGAFLDLLGVSVILPFIYAILDIERLKNNAKVKPILDIIGIHSNIAVIAFIVSGVVIIYVVKNLLLMYIKYRQERFACSYKKEVSIRMLEAFLYQPYEYFVNANLAEILRGVFSDVEGSYNAISTMFIIATDVFGAIVIGIYLVYTDPFIALGTFLIAILCIIVLFTLVKNKTKKIGYQQRQLNADAYKSVGQAVNGIKEILVMKRQKEFLVDYERAYEEKRRIDICYNCLTALPTKVIETFFISGLAIIVGVRSITTGAADNVNFTAKMAIFAVGAVKLLPYISQISAGFTQLVYSRLNILSIYNNLKSTEKFISEGKERIITSSTSFISSDTLTFEQELSARDIHWHYRGVQKDTINGLSLTVKKGEAIGIIGESGAGKSTLVDIILGLFVPQSGGVYTDDKSIYDDMNSWSKLIGYVPQSIYLMDDTIRNNVLFGLSKPENDDAIWEALDKAQLKEFVKSQPAGLDTIVGDRGVKMSGGQRQRLAIARTLYYNPPILVLDEATSALDNETEETLMESIEALRGEKTLIIVAHRLSTIENCDHIYEVVGGNIRERNKKEIFG